MSALATARGRMADSLWLALAFSVFIAVAAGLAELPGRDSSAFVYVADGMLAGEQVYVERWDHKPPGIYILNGLARVLDANGFSGIRLVEAAWMLAWMGLAYGLLADAFGRVSAGFAVCVVLVCAARLLEGGNFTEEYALLPQFAALWCFRRHLRVGGQHWAFSIGALGAVACLFKPNLCGLWLAIGAFWLFRLNRRASSIAAACAGGALVAALAGLALLGAGSWAGFLDAVWVYNNEYAQNVSTAERLQALQISLATVPLVMPVLLIWLIALPLALSGATSVQSADLLRLGVIALPLEIGMTAMSGRAYLHYYLALLPAYAIVLAAAAARVEAGANRLKHRLPPRLGTGLPSAILVIILVALPLPWSALLAGIDPTHPQAIARTAAREAAHQVAARIASRTSPEETVLVWGAATELHLLSKRGSPSRFFYQYPLVTRGYASPELTASFLAELERARPALVVDTANPYLPSLSMSARTDWQPPHSGYRVPLSHLAAFFTWFDDNFVALESIGAVTIYGRR